MFWGLETYTISCILDKRKQLTKPIVLWISAICSSRYRCSQRRFSSAMQQSITARLIRGKMENHNQNRGGEILVQAGKNHEVNPILGGFRWIGRLQTSQNPSLCALLCVNMWGCRVFLSHVWPHRQFMAGNSLLILHNCLFAWKGVCVLDIQTIIYMQYTKTTLPETHIFSPLKMDAWNMKNLSWTGAI